MPEHHLTSSEQRQQQPPRRFTRSAAEREKTGHNCSVLSTIGHPASPEELASRCRSSDATADSVPRLCSIPNSPIYLADKGLVSAAAVSASGEFVPDTMRNGNVKAYSRKRKRQVSNNARVPTAAKRRLHLPTENGEADGKLGCLPNASNCDFLEGNSNNERALVPLPLDYNPPESSSFCMTHLEHREGNAGVQSSTLMHEESPPDVHHSLLTIGTDSCSLKPVEVDRGTACFLDVKLPPQSSSYDRKPCQEAVAGNRRLENETDYTPTFSLEEDKQSNMDAGIHDTHLCKASTDQLIKDAQTLVENNVEDGFPEFGAEAEAEHFVLSVKLGEALASCLDSRNAVNITLDKDQSMKKAESMPDPILAECPSPKKQLGKSSGKLKGLFKNFPCQERVLMESLEYNELVNIPKQENQCKTYQKSRSIEPNWKSSKKKNIHAKENMVDTTSLSPQLEKIQLPQLDNFIIEEEEGSGGYGTVYRAKRKNDGKIFAIKYPHVKAHKHHVDTERKMLERFGGRNFIIKYEGSFRSGDSECFILEHVEHDRAEVLKKEIDLYQLQWYGYCMFRALNCLHQQDVVHRDVKPGNFLFSRRLNKGYLIDFNLAKHLPQKYTIGSKSKSSPHVSFSHVPLPQSKSALLNGEKKFVTGDLTDTKLGQTTDSKRTHEPRKDVRKRDNDGPLKIYPDMGGGNRYKIQGAKGSGMTSAKDVISTRTPSTERAREPLPCLGRKELISLVQDAVLGPNHDAKNTPASQRKRIAAPPGKIDNKIIYTSPMSLHFTGGSVSAAKLLKSKGNGRQKKEGSCVGTKGFRAPEVLLRSLHQGPKVDVWSAGVTLLYLIMGRTPFTGEPEQSIKDIASLRGSEDLWEVAKLHDRESSFPVELLDIKSLPSMKLQSWCKARTKRGQFFRQIPRSLFDLVDKCLTVNPRQRISAEEALQHEFFAPCHESLMKQRMFRREVMSTQNE
ncbi:unnamed protein product [Malus baccata var. baccata]